MTSPEFQHLLDADPFVPFAFTLAGGSGYTVDRPERVTVRPGECAELVLPDGRWAIVALDHVVSIDFVAPTAVVTLGRSGGSV